MVGTVIQWPDNLLRTALPATPYLDANTRQGQPDLSGKTQIISTGMQIWKLTLELAIEGDPDLVRSFNAFLAQMKGMANIAEFSIYDCHAYDARVSPAQNPFSTGEYFSTGYGFKGDGVQPVVASAASAIGDTTITVSTTDPIIAPLRVGDYFSHNNFLHIVTGWSSGVVSFLPALRSAVAIDDVLATTPPIVRMRFASDGEGRHQRTINGYRPTLSLNFVEVFDR
jgi:hypothetical protein